MPIAQRSKYNPLISPDPRNEWEAEGAFNGCPIVEEATGDTLMLYRAFSRDKDVSGQHIKLSTVALARSKDGINFTKFGPVIFPEHDWERFGCEDPRVTRIGIGADAKYYIFYTALSEYPFGPNGIKIAVAITKDFKTFEKHPVTFFNAKAMALFPEKIGGKFAALLTLHSDMPPAKTCLVQFEREEELWSRDFWEEWYRRRAEHVICLKRSPYDHIEIGAAPLKTKQGWLVFYSYIKNYFNPPAIFGIEAVVLDLKNPLQMLSRTFNPLLVPLEQYELAGQVAHIVFPSGALIEKKGAIVQLYYGGADTVCARAEIKLADLYKAMHPVELLERFSENPVIYPDPDSAWQKKATFNPAAIYIKGKVNVLYRAMGDDNTSVVGLARSKDGLHMTERFPDPIYTPRIDAEEKRVANGNSGCEDARVTVIKDTVYMCYTAYNGQNPPSVALTSIALKDFAARKWNWTIPQIISQQSFDDKDAALFPEKIGGKFVFLHRLRHEIYIDHMASVDFSETGERLNGLVLLSPRAGMWDDEKIGISGPPLKTKKGWLLLYHGISKQDHHYRVGAALLDLKDPRKVIAQLPEPILQPEYPYETEGEISNVVFPCGSALIGNTLFVYYGGADRVVGVASLKLPRLIAWLESFKNKK